MDYKIYVIFPHSQEIVCKIITQHIFQSFLPTTIGCESITYSPSKIDIKKINEVLEEKCILIIGYEGNISYENFYKLGMAHAKDGIVILVNILTKDNHVLKKNPEYIRKHFFVAFRDKELDRMKKSLEDIIKVISENDFPSILYLKAIQLCEDLEEKAQFTITKVNQEEFKKRLSNYETYFFTQYKTKLLNLYLEDDKNLYTTLLYCICNHDDQVLRIQERANSQRQSQSSGNDVSSEEKFADYLVNITNNYNINQYGEGDNVAGDAINGDKITR